MSEKKTLAQKLADEARRQYEESKKKKESAAKVTSQAESLMADVQAKLDAQKSAAEKAAESAAKKASETKASAESLMADLTAKLQAKQPKVAKAAKKEHEIYVVQPGDSLSKIAKEKYGDMMRWSEIFEANKDQIADPNIIQVGQRLIIPPK